MPMSSNRDCLQNRHHPTYCHPTTAPLPPRSHARHHTSGNLSGNTIGKHSGNEIGKNGKAARLQPLTHPTDT
ncbi:MAG TPA: hypothetical protein VF510_25445, partial [Ktedonobacterales bacterium]